MIYDAVIIGGGVVGAAAAFELSRYKLKTVVLERENDVALGATRANSAIVHAGYDPEPGTVMARLNVEGNALIWELAEKLNLHHSRCGSYVLAFGKEDDEHLKELKRRADQNKVPCEIVGRDELRRRESALSDECTSALYAPTAGVILPWELCFALAETAAKNGVEFRFGFNVDSISKRDEFIIKSGEQEVHAHIVINAAGVYSDVVNDMAAPHLFTVKPAKGEYWLLDKSQGGIVNSVIFQCPGPEGKGILVSPTVHGNLIVGPSATPCEREDVSCGADILEFVKQKGLKSVPSVNFRENIRNFCGVRANTDRDDFIIGEHPECENFINLAGIKSPGLTSAPAIARELVRIIAAKQKLEEKEQFILSKRPTPFKALSDDEKAALIAKDPAYGRIICRCETVSEGEIKACFDSPLPPRTLDGVKRRAGTGMGRCQGGFCAPRVHALIAGYFGVDETEIEKDRNGSYILSGHTKEVK